VSRSSSWFSQSFCQPHLLILLVRKHLLKIHNLNLRKILLINNGSQSFLWFSQSFCQSHLLILLVRICF
jgi:hypothetical protein